MKCKHIREMMGAYLYGDLAPEEMRRLREHVERCEECREDLHGRGTVAASLDNTACNLTDEDRQEIMWSVKGAVRAKERASRGLALRFVPTFGVAAVLLLGFAIGFVVNSQRTTPVHVTAGEESLEPKVEVVEQHATTAENPPQVSAPDRMASDPAHDIRPTPPRRNTPRPRYPLIITVSRSEHDKRSQIGNVDAPLLVLPDAIDEVGRGSGVSDGKLPKPVDLGSADLVPVPEE